MRARDVDRSADGTKTAFQDVKEGFRFVRSRVWLWGTFLAATLAYLIFWGPSEVLLPFIVKNDMHGSASDLGFILALGGIGAMFAAVVMGNRNMPRRHITFMYGVWTLSTLAVAGFGLAALPLAGDGRVLRLQCPGGSGNDRLGDHEGPPRPGAPAGTGLELRLVHLDRPRAPLLRDHRPRGRRFRGASNARRRGHLGRDW